ncbi:uncharacterized protein [Nicotiana sylvestris]|uniref:uncharacterized protein n=1 Tax=Nicotiana sylvestris TaxID=4096 RepID=UPI00388CE83B
MLMFIPKTNENVLITGMLEVSTPMLKSDSKRSVLNHKIPNNMVKPNDEVRIDIDDNGEVTQEEVNPARDHIIDIPELDRVTKKRSMNFETINVTNQVSAIAHSIASKLEDPGAFTIPCTIGSAEFAKALCDLGESINLMPYSIFTTLQIWKPRPISMRLQMANCTMKMQLGVIEGVLVYVDKFILLADFVILDCKVDYEVPIILGRPFLDMGKALCNVEAVDLTIWVGDEKVVFHVYFIIDDTSDTINVGDMLEAILLNFIDDEMDGFLECVNSLQGMGSYNYAPRKLSLDLKNRTTPPTKPSTEEPPTMELKPLPPHLRYEFLGIFHIGSAKKEEEGYWMEFGRYSGDKPHLLHA